MEKEYNYSVRDLPKSERPREKLRDKGASNVSSSELLAIILGKGVKGESVLLTVQKMILHFGGLHNLLEASLNDLMKIRGIGLAK